MRFTVVEEVPVAREKLYFAMRDHVREMLHLIDAVESVETLERVQEGPLLSLRSRWVGAVNDAPAVIRPLLKPEYRTWMDRGRWDASKFTTEWELEIPMLPGGVTARGKNQYEELDEETTIWRVNGEFTVHPDRLPAVIAPIARAAQGTVERFVVGAVEQSMRNSMKIAQRWLEDNG